MVAEDEDEVAPAGKALGAVEAEEEDVFVAQVEAVVEVEAGGEDVLAPVEVAPGGVVEAKGEVVVVLVDDGPGVEDGRLGNRSLSFQTSGMHGEGLLGLFGACQQNECGELRGAASSAGAGEARQRQQAQAGPQGEVAGAGGARLVGWFSWSERKEARREERTWLGVCQEQMPTGSSLGFT